MPFNQIFLTSLTGVFLANGAPTAVLSTVAEQWPSDRAFALPQRRSERSVDALHPSDWKARLAANALSLAGLAPGWDGPRSVSIPESLLARAVFYVESALKSPIDGDAQMTAPRLVPGGDGSLQIEWHTRRGELEFDIDDRSAGSIWIRDHLSGAEFNGEGSEALALFYRWAPWIASQRHDATYAPIQAQMVPTAIAA